MVDKYISLKTIMESPMRQFVRIHTGETKPEDWVISGANIMRIPAADVVEVVRCGNCEHWRGPNQICRGIGVDFDANGFCPYGERRADNG